MDLGANEWIDLLEGDLPADPARASSRRRCSPSRLSIDDFVITNLVSGATTNTFPIWVYGIQKNALPVQINVIGSIVFLGAVAFVADLEHRLGPSARRMTGRRSMRRPTGARRSTRRRHGRRSPARPLASCRRSGAGSRTSSSTAARARG